MPRDAKFGLVVGLALVLLIALLFFRREGAAQAPAAPAPPRAVAPTPAPKIAPPPRVDAPPPPKIMPPPQIESDELPPPAFNNPSSN